MGKFIIKESELKKIIENKVRDIISELNRTTYINYAQKAGLKGDIDRSKRFSQYASDTFNKEYNTGKYRFKINPVGFQVDFRLNNKMNTLTYYLKQDSFYLNKLDKGMELNQYNLYHHLQDIDEELKKLIFKYFNEFNPNSKFNNEKVWGLKIGLF